VSCDTMRALAFDVGRKTTLNTTITCSRACVIQERDYCFARIRIQDEELALIALEQ